MKTNWRTKKLGEVAELHYGKGISKTDRKMDGTFPVYGANGELGRTDKFLVEGEAIIVGRKGSAGEVTRISGKFWPSDVTYYVFGNDQVDIDYLFYFFKSVNLTQFARGVKPGINRNDVYDLEIPLPPLSTQKEIVKMLDEKMGKIAEAKRLRAEALADTEKILPQTLHEIFAEGKKDGWEEKELGDIVKMSSGDFLPSTEQIQGLHKIYGGNGILGTHHEYNSEERTLVIGRVGAHCGAVHITDPQSWITDNALRVTSLNYNVDLNYLALFLRNAKLNQFAKTSAQPSISQLTIKKIKILIPPLAEQQKIVAKLDTLSEKIRTLRTLQTTQLADLKSLERAYLSEAFGGGNMVG